MGDVWALLENRPDFESQVGHNSFAARFFLFKTELVYIILHDPLSQ